MREESVVGFRANTHTASSQRDNSHGVIVTHSALCTYGRTLPIHSFVWPYTSGSVRVCALLVVGFSDLFAHLDVSFRSRFSESDPHLHLVAFVCGYGTRTAGDF